MPRSGAAGTDAAQALIAPYLDIVAALNPGGPLRLYPGSPLIVKALLRRQDRLIACELEPSAAASLEAVLRGDARAKALAMDGWMALFANIPPKERRGLVVIDPPYEESMDFARLSQTVAQAHRKWANGVYLLWYPIKTRAAPDALARRAGRLRADYHQSALPLAARIAGSSSRTHAAARADGRLPPRLALERMSLSRLFSLARVDQRQGFVLI